MARPKDKAEIGPAIKGALKRALLMMENDGRPLSTIWMELFESEPANALRLAISTMPKEMEVTSTTLTPEQWLEYMADGSIPEGVDTAEAIQGPVH